MKALYCLSATRFDDIYGPEERAALARRVEIPDSPLTPETYEASTHTWPEVEAIFSGWGMVRADNAFLQRFPRLKIVFYGAGSIRNFVTEAFWDAGLRVTTAAAANAVPVAEFTVSQIIYALKQGWRQVRAIRRQRCWLPPLRSPGAYRSTVALLSLGTIGRMVAQRLQSYDLRVIAYDPHVSEDTADRIGVRLVSLEEAFAQANVVSCHIPLLAETEGIIRKHHFSSMKPNAAFINTARGAVIDEDELISVLKKRSDLTAVLDVTRLEPLPETSALYRLENVVLTPHIAGSIGPECRRMGRAMIEELDLFLADKPLRHEITRSKAPHLA